MTYLGIDLLACWHERNWNEHHFLRKVQILTEKEEKFEKYSRVFTTKFLSVLFVMVRLNTVHDYLTHLPLDLTGSRHMTVAPDSRFDLMSTNI